MKFIISFIMVLAVLVPSSYGDMYKWVDEKGRVHFTDDLSTIPEKYREDVESLKLLQEISTPRTQEMPKNPLHAGVAIPKGITVDLVQRGNVSFTEVLLNESVRQHFIVDTGASFTVISQEAAKELGITIDGNTPIIPTTTASSVIFNPLVTLRSIRVGEAEVENVDVLVHNLPGHSAGLLGNSFLSKFKVVLDSINGKMTLYSMQGTPSPDRPGGYAKDFWVSQFRFYTGALDMLNNVKQRYEARAGSSSELIRINNAIRYFENQLSELERRASFAGVPRDWRQ
ncbi:MAG TPA: retroviral-like aspartic protease family protein [Thermodesulfobacteriota bacterium]|nr:retroviral-like aspartic protease family protein [Thermodesulfobacteriota bacterium]